MTTYYIHPKERGLIRVTRLRHYHGQQDKKYLTHAAWIDPPGTSWEDEWNLHYDGCDYQKGSFIECLMQMVDYDCYELDGQRHYKRDRCTLLFTSEPYIEPRGGEPAYKFYRNFKF